MDDVHILRYHSIYLFNNKTVNDKLGIWLIEENMFHFI